jgi:hypothetical protein
MNKNVLLWVLVLLIPGISACELSDTTSGPWIPVLEDAGFSHLNDSVSEAVKALREASDKIQIGEKAESSEAVQRAMNALLKLHFYYIPMTEVRQLVYDADRLFYLKQSDATQNKLREANKFLGHVADSDGPNLKRSVNELIVMIDELILNIQESSSAGLEKFREVGHRVNLMLLDGEFVLSDARFDHEH